MATSGQGVAGLMVDPTNQNTCNVILWPPQVVLSSPQSATIQTAPVATVLPSAAPLGSIGIVTLRLWDAEGNASTPFVQYQLAGSSIWLDATLVSLDAAPYTFSNRVVTAPGGINHTVAWNVQADLGMNISKNILLRARARDFSLFGDWSSGTPFIVQTTASPDSDGDGIPDWWELRYFGNLTHNGLLDTDGDGVADLQEFTADTNPTNSASYLRFTSAYRISAGLVINWQGGINATQFIERINSLTTNNWHQIFTNLPPTPINGSYTDAPGTNTTEFYRIKATR